MTLLAHCLASHLQVEPHGLEPPFCRHHSSQPRLTTAATGMASSGQARPHLGAARDRHGLDELSRDACMTMSALGWTFSCASRMWHGSPSSTALQIFPTWTLIPCRAALLDACPRPPPFLDESYLTTTTAYLFMLQSLTRRRRPTSSPSRPPGSPLPSPTTTSTPPSPPSRPSEAAAPSQSR